MKQTHSDKLKAKFGDSYFRDIRKKVKNPGFKGNPELARKAANKRWANKDDKADKGSQPS